jgi:hypothetical protein
MNKKICIDKNGKPKGIKGAKLNVRQTRMDHQ